MERRLAVGDQRPVGDERRQKGSRAWYRQAKRRIIGESGGTNQFKNCGVAAWTFLGWQRDETKYAVGIAGFGWESNWLARGVRASAQLEFGGGMVNTTSIRQRV